MAQELALGLIVQFHSPPLQTLQAVRELGIPTVHALYSARYDNEQGIAEILDACKETGIEITTVFCGYPGESYADIPTVQKTVGLVPQETRRERLATTERITRFAAALGVDRIGAHIGFIPENIADPEYDILVQTVKLVCDQLMSQGQVLGLETGQETAAQLQDFLNHVSRENLKVNFDPANMILYGKDQPIPALDILFPWIDGVHCKDGRWPTEPHSLGEETPLGEGDVDFSRWLTHLLKLGYRGPLTIEREITGDQQRQDILQAKELILSLL